MISSRKPVIQINKKGKVMAAYPSIGSTRLRGFDSSHVFHVVNGERYSHLGNEFRVISSSQRSKMNAIMGNWTKPVTNRKILDEVFS